jgi:hypothetical protein
VLKALTLPSQGKYASIAPHLLCVLGCV